METNVEKLDDGMVTDIEYLVAKRDNALERFNCAFEGNLSLDIINGRFEILIKMEKNLRLAEDALMIYRVTAKKQKDESKLG